MRRVMVTAAAGAAMMLLTSCAHDALSGYSNEPYMDASSAACRVRPRGFFHVQVSQQLQSFFDEVNGVWTFTNERGRTERVVIMLNNRVPLLLRDRFGEFSAGYAPKTFSEYRELDPKRASLIASEFSDFEKQCDRAGMSESSERRQGLRLMRRALSLTHPMLMEIDHYHAGRNEVRLHMALTPNDDAYAYKIRIDRDLTGEAEVTLNGMRLRDGRKLTESELEALSGAAAFALERQCI